MNEIICNNPIGVFDSGVGGLSVLQCAAELLPNENFIYLGDFANAPYGNRSLDEILRISINNANMLMDLGIKALLIACNTATSASATMLRQMCSIPVVGLEPAIKPAAKTTTKNKSIAVLATPQTIQLDKFKNLLKQFDCNFNPIACAGLSRLIENEEPHSHAIKEYLSEILCEINTQNTSSIILGCTHFSFVAEDITNITNGIKLYDGRFGAARQLKRVLNNNLAASGGSIKLISSIDDDFHHQLMNKFMKFKLLKE